MGFKVKEAREAAGLTQQELADKSGVSRGTIAAIEGGRNTNVTASTLVKIAVALEKPINEIFFTDSVKST